MFSFEKLAVWQKAIEYADFVYKVTKEFPADERFGLSSQLRRSAVSVSANVAEVPPVPRERTWHALSRSLMGRFWNR